MPPGQCYAREEQLNADKIRTSDLFPFHSHLSTSDVPDSAGPDPRDDEDMMIPRKCLISCLLLHRSPFSILHFDVFVCGMRIKRGESVSPMCVSDCVCVGAVLGSGQWALSLPSLSVGVGLVRF